MDDFDAPMASLSLTHVYYNPSDPISYVCAWLALLPQALCIVYATLILSHREAEVALMFAGQLACEAANFALKRLIKEERPARIHGKGYGMPSSHAQFVVFWAVSVCLFLIVRHQPRSQTARRRHGRKSSSSSPAAWTRRGRRAGSLSEAAPAAAAVLAAAVTGRSISGSPGKGGRNLSPREAEVAVERYAHSPWSTGERGVVGAAALALACLVAWSRVYLGYHTPKQVLVGCAAGALCAFAWFAATAALRQTGLLTSLLDFPVARWLRVRDLVVEEDLAQAGWEKWERRQVAMRRAKDK